MAVTLANVRADVGEIYSLIDNGTTTINSLIDKAENTLVSITGTSLGFDNAVRNLADAFVCNNMVSSIHSINKSFPNMNIGSRDVKGQRDSFLAMAEKELKIKGYSIDGLRILFSVNNL